MKAFVLFVIFAVSITQSVSFAQRRGGSRGGAAEVIERVLRCESEKNQLRDRLYQCENYSSRPSVWSCTAGCQGLGNVGFGSGSTEAEARAASLKNLGFTCSHHTFDCNREQ